MKHILFILLLSTFLSCERSPNNSAFFEVYVDDVFQFDHTDNGVNGIDAVNGAADFRMNFQSGEIGVLVSWTGQLDKVTEVINVNGTTPFMEGCEFDFWVHSGFTLTINEHNGTYNGTMTSVAMCDETRNLRIDFSGYELN